jgi:HD-GYP domain-containing protein (c-di-GMP phosphodiesterase class II)
LDATVLVVIGVWCLLAVVVFFLLVRPVFGAGARNDALVAIEAELLRSTPPPAPPEAAVPVAEPSHAAHLVETGYLGLVQDRLCRYVRVVLGLERSWLLLRDSRDREHVIVAAARGCDPEQVGRRLPAETGAMGLMLRSPRPTVLPQSGVAPGDPGAAVARGARLVAAAPVAWEGMVRGALAVATRDPDRTLGMEDLELLGEVAGLSGAALAVGDRRAELAGTVAGQVDALTTALAIWDGHTRAHSEGVVRLTRLTGARMGLARAELLELELAALLHDVGKLRVPREILRKPGTLSQSEQRLMRNHPVWGAELVSGVPGLQAVALIVRHHHERVDGEGYPSRLAGVRIPVASRIVAVCDAFGAMTEPRAYGARRSEHDALVELRHEAGSQFDPAVVDALEAEVEDGTRALAGAAH